MVSVSSDDLWAEKGHLTKRFASLDRIGLSDVFCLAVLCVVVLAWSRFEAAALPSWEEGGVGQVWRDVFLHADQIAQYTRVDGLARGSILLAGQPVEP